MHRFKVSDAKLLGVYHLPMLRFFINAEARYFNEYQILKYIKSHNSNIVDFAQFDIALRFEYTGVTMRL